MRSHGSVIQVARAIVTLIALLLALVAAAGCSDVRFDSGSAAAADDCDGSKDCRGPFTWGEYIDLASCEAVALAVDVEGNVVITGNFDSRGDGRNGPVSTYEWDIFIAKVDALGHQVWTRRFGGAGQHSAGDVAVDSLGNVLVTGSFNGELAFDEGSLVCPADQFDVFIAKLDRDGNHLWSKHFGSDYADGKSIAVDADRNVLVGGPFAGELDFGAGPLEDTAAGSYVVMLDSDGEVLWSENFSAGFPQLSSIAPDGGGGVVMAGTFWGGEANFGGGPLPNAGAGDIFLARLDANGDHVWSRAYGDAAEQYATDVAVDPAGNVVFTGAVLGIVDVGGGPLPEGGESDILLAKLDASGKHMWSWRAGDGSRQSPMGLAVQGNDIVLAGGVEGSMDLGTGPLVSAGDKDIFVAKFDGAGQAMWALRFGDSQRQFAIDVALDPAGAVVLAATGAGDVDFGVPVSGPPGEQVVMKLAP